MLTNYTIRFMKSMYVKSLATMVVMACLATAQLDAQTKTPQKEAPQKVAAAPAIPQSVILPAFAAQQLNGTFRFTEEPGVQMFARNSGSVEIIGFPHMEKLERLLTEQSTARPMQFEEFMRTMMPGPVILGDNKKDAVHYEASLKLFFAAHPEVLWVAPAEVRMFLGDPNGYAKMVELQVSWGNFIAFAPREAAPGPAQIKE
jgi:hypothetical protein